ncbi:MAG: septal ring lytic transglycosylase RlpA family protein [Woeseiaceae bacterium]|nr:septal ring lytic transglycosylase RlpA family protein [Woeseiaceae bacterium]
MHRDRLKFVVCLLLATALTGCGSNKVKGDGPPSGSIAIPDLPGDAIPRPEPRSKYGNGPIYEVLGQAYRVLDTHEGYRERGVASWYGKKFHGNLTSMRETYDMYAMTAAHKTLPLPSYVRVRNLSNGKNVVVRVNDRGPFVHNRVIDLSYAAALKLDMVKDGTSLVEVEAISFNESSGDRPTRRTTAAPRTESRRHEVSNTVYVQVGAFGDRGNARRRIKLLRSGGIGNTRVFEDKSTGQTLYRVRIGPVRNVEQYDLIVDELGKLGISDPYLVAE